jgi:glycyl-tRNA synthetase
VLDVSGHTEKFADLMVKDTTTGECFRADKLLEDHIENLMASDSTMTSDRRAELRKIAAQADAYSPEQLHEQLLALEIKSPTGGELSPPFPFNLMFQTSIGPAGNSPGFLRPETAQGIFVNFRRLLEYNNQRTPFAAAQIGTAYRNEISPRGGLLRVREFTMAEIEHFVKPDQKDHPKFADVAAVSLPLFAAANQLGDGKITSCTIGEAVASGLVDNETLGYFMARTYLFLVKVGVQADCIRFRQHLPTEMAHYASDCWDAEILMSSGWVECVGHADRACFDLKAHAKAANEKLEASYRFPEGPRVMEVVQAKLNRGVMGKTFKAHNKAVQEALAGVLEDLEASKAMAAKLEAGEECVVSTCEGDFAITPDMISFKFPEKRVAEVKFTPSVVEPSFGIGRIMTAILEHSFYNREGDDGARNVLALPAVIAPVKVSVLPLSKIADINIVNAVATQLTLAGVSNAVDVSNVSIGRRYARTDEIGIPFGVTVDDQSALDGCVTLRERDSMGQVRIPLADISGVVADLANGVRPWSDVAASYPAQKEAGAVAPTVVEGADRRYGRFARPAVPILE